MSVKDHAPSWLAKLLESFGKDPKKGTFLSVLVVVLAVLWGRMLLGSKTPPAAHANLTAPMDRRDNSGNSRTSSGALGGRPTSLLEWARLPVTPVRRNLFSIPMDYYPTVGSVAGGHGADTAGFWDQMAKSMSAKADQQEQRRILVENVRTLAASLKLQSIIMGSQPSAMINGEIVREGSVINGFRVLTIEARRIVVEHETVRLEFLMK